MTELKYEYLSCPYCQDETERAVFQSIDLSEDADLAEKVLKKEINAYLCMNCGREFVMAFPLTVIIPDSNLLLAYLPEINQEASEHLGLNWRFEPTGQEAKEWQEAVYAEENAALDAGESLDKLQVLSNRLNRALPPSLSVEEYRKRSVYVREHLAMYKTQEPLAGLLERYAGWEMRLLLDYNDLIEKLQIVLQGLDDKAIELIKYVSKRSSANQGGNCTLERLYFVKISDEALLFLAYDANGWDYLDLPRETYDNTALYKDYLSYAAELDLVDEGLAASWWDNICACAN